MPELHAPDRDLYDCLESNNYNHGYIPALAPYDVRGTVATIAGAGDELSWFWVARLNHGVGEHADVWVLIEGWCDNTGWDCSSGYTVRTANHAVAAARLAPEIDGYGRSNIRSTLIAQVLGFAPYGLYTQERGA